MSTQHDWGPIPFTLPNPDAENSGVLSRKVALVTNAGRGIGASIAMALAEAGADVLLHYSSHEREVLELQEKVLKLNRYCIFLRADLSQSTQIRDMFAVIKKYLHHVDILVNNPNTFVRRSFVETDEVVWNAMLDANLKAAYLLTQEAVPGMSEYCWGRIIIVTLGWQTCNNPPYAASMHGIIGLSHSYARLLTKHGVTVNAIVSGPIIDEDSLDPGNRQVCPESMAFLRDPDPGEIASVVVSLACSGEISGQSINLKREMFLA